MFQEAPHVTVLPRKAQTLDGSQELSPQALLERSGIPIVRSELGAGPRESADTETRQ
jgi:hypothetical protein